MLFDWRSLVKRIQTEIPNIDELPLINDDDLGIYVTPTN